MNREQITFAEHHARAMLSLLAQIDEIEKRDETSDARVSVGFLRGLLEEHVLLCDQLLDRS
jgi:hypothetical protein